MTLGTFFQAIISIFFIYTCLALFTSELQEYIATYFEFRAKRLKQSIRQMLGEQDYPLYPLKFIESKGESVTSGNDFIIYLIDGIIYKNTKKSENIEEENGHSYIWISNKNHQEIIEKEKIIKTDNNQTYFIHKDLKIKSKKTYWTARQIDSNTNIWIDQDRGYINEVKSKELITINQTIWIANENNQEKEIKSNGINENPKEYQVYQVTQTIPANSRIWLDEQNNKAYLVKNTNNLSPEGLIFINKHQEEVDPQKVTPFQGEDYQIGDKSYIYIATKYECYDLNTNEQKRFNDRCNYFLRKGGDQNNEKFEIVNVKLGKPAVTKQLPNISFKVNSLTELLYEHKNITSLNQSSFAWLSILNLGKVGKRKFLLNLLCIVITIIIIIIIFLPIPPIYRILSFIVLLGLIIISINKFNYKFEGKVRESEGPSYINSPVFATTLIDILEENTTPGIDNLEKRLDTLEFYTPAKSVLRKWLKDLQNEQQVNNNLEGDKRKNSRGFTKKELITALEEKYKTLYEEVQERSSGVYKRNAKGLSFLLGLLMAIIFNADTFNIISHLTQENNDVVNQLISELDKQEDNFFTCQEGDNDCFDEEQKQRIKAIFNNIDNLPLGWKAIDENVRIINDLNTIITPLETLNQPGQPCAVINVEDNQQCFEAIEKILSENVQIARIISTAKESETLEFKTAINNGRNDQGEIQDLSTFRDTYLRFLNKQKEKRFSEALSLTDNPQELFQQIRTQIEEQGSWGKVILGWLITGVAIAMGAPFWFDLLGRVINVRNAGNSTNLKKDSNS